MLEFSNLYGLEDFLKVLRLKTYQVEFVFRINADDIQETLTYVSEGKIVSKN